MFELLVYYFLFDLKKIQITFWSVRFPLRGNIAQIIFLIIPMTFLGTRHSWMEGIEQNLSQSYSYVNEYNVFDWNSNTIHQLPISTRYPLNSLHESPEEFLQQKKNKWIAHLTWRESNDIKKMLM